MWISACKLARFCNDLCFWVTALRGVQKERTLTGKQRIPKLQIQLPIFPEGVTYINQLLAFEKRDGVVTYLNGHMPVFSHDENDLKTFRMITAQFCVQGTARQVEIHRVFGVPAITVKRAVKRYREHGPEGFYQPRRTRGAAILTEDVLAAVQSLLDVGMSIPNIALELGLKADTLRKAAKAGRLQKKKTPESIIPVENSIGEIGSSSTKSERSAVDNAAVMGMGTTNLPDRLLASLGQAGPPEVQFQPSLDVLNGGVLFAIPALIATGLLRHTDKFFQLPKGFYDITRIFLVLAFMALCRIRSVEGLRYFPPGEWGKLVGLDRIPEAKTLREKVAILAQGERPFEWSAALCSEWMEELPTGIATLYVDGHVRVYNGEQTKLPKKYVARQRLCLRGVTDYWVNAMDGQPFFVVTKEVDSGLLQVLEKNIIPRLEQDVPNQPTPEQLMSDPWLQRFVVVFDREGYSPEFFRKMWKKRIACITYHKYPGENWNEAEFSERQVQLSSGDVVKMKLAERGTFLVGGKIWVREIRKLCAGGHQTSVLSTLYRSDPEPIAVRMFSRWSQENYFKYMRQHFDLDGLISYKLEEIPDTTMVVNPEHRRLDGEVRKKVARLVRRRAEFGKLALTEDIEPNKVEKYEYQKAELQEEVEALEKEVEILKSQRKAQPRHMTVAELPEGERFSRLNSGSKHFIDTIKMIAYRAESGMAITLRETMAREDDSRSLLRAIYNSEADLIPDDTTKTLTVRLHHLANWNSDAAAEYLCKELNATETIYPGTEYRMVFELVS